MHTTLILLAKHADAESFGGIGRADRFLINWRATTCANHCRLPGISGRRDNVTAHIDHLHRAIAPVLTKVAMVEGIGRIPILYENIIAGFIPTAI